MSPTFRARLVRRIIAHFPTTLRLLAFGLVVASGTYFYVQHTKTSLEAARHHSDQQFAKALILTDRKFHQALSITTRQFSYAQNKSVCGFRKIATDGIAAERQVIARSKAALKDPTTPPGSKERNRKAKHDAEIQIQRAISFRRSQITVPFDFDCSTLPKRPPKP